jgi:hypothetical protein
MHCATGRRNAARASKASTNCARCGGRRWQTKRRVVSAEDVLDRLERKYKALAKATGPAKCCEWCSPASLGAIWPHDLNLACRSDIGRLGQHHDQVRIGNVERRAVFGELDFKNVLLILFTHEVADLPGE